LRLERLVAAGSVRCDYFGLSSRFLIPALEMASRLQRSFRRTDAAKTPLVLAECDVVKQQQ